MDFANSGILQNLKTMQFCIVRVDLVVAILRRELSN